VGGGEEKGGFPLSSLPPVTWHGGKKRMGDGFPHPEGAGNKRTTERGGGKGKGGGFFFLDFFGHREGKGFRPPSKKKKGRKKREAAFDE